MNRLERLTAILIHLQSKQIVTAQELADRFLVTQRTIYRDIRALEESGVPISSEVGIGFFLIEGYHLPPVTFTPEEASALVIGSKFISGQTDSTIHQQYQSALYKIRSILSAESQKTVNTTDSAIEVTSVNRNLHYAQQMQYLTTLQSAIHKCVIVNLIYRSEFQQETTERVIEPLGLKQYGTFWYLIAFCLKRDDYRVFKLTSIQKLSLSSQDFDREKRLSAKQLRQKFDQHRPKTIVVDILVQSQNSHYLSKQKYVFGLIEEVTKSDGVHMRFEIYNQDAMARWLIGYGKMVKVLSPPALIQRMKTLAQEISEFFLINQQY